MRWCRLKSLNGMKGEGGVRFARLGEILTQRFSSWGRGVVLAPNVLSLNDCLGKNQTTRLRVQDVDLRCFVIVSPASILSPEAFAMSLSASILEHPVPKANQEQVVQLLSGATAPNQTVSLQAYFSYYTEQCRTAHHACAGLGVKTHQEVVDLSTKLASASTRAEIVADLVNKQPVGSQPGKSDYIESAVDLAVRLMLMVDVGEFQGAGVFMAGKRLLWAQGTLTEFVHSLFSPQATERGKVSALFTARNLSRIAGFKVELTTNLADHLRFRDSDMTVTVFHHATFLGHQLE